MSALSPRDEVYRPIELARSAIEEDDPNALKELLINSKDSPGDHSKLVGEDTLVDVTTKENLLHYAVQCASVKCVQLLTRPPYLWSPDRPNHNGRTAFQSAETLGYPHVLFLIAANSCTGDVASLLNLPDADRRCIANLLLYPHVFLEKPWSSYSILSVATHGLSANGLSPMVLFFELLLSTPEIVQQPLRGFLKFWPWSWSHKHHVAKCTGYPNCLCYVFIITFIRERVFAFFCNWSAHRLMTAQYPRDVDNSSSGNAAPNFSWSPMRLQEHCRIVIRRLVTLNLRDQTKKKRDVGATWSGAWNYANSLNRLPLPKHLRDFLAYQELWPTTSLSWWKR